MWLLNPKHKHIGQDTLSEYLDGRLLGRDLERVEQGLEVCDVCRLDLEELQATVAMLRQLPMATPRHSFVMSAPPPEPARARQGQGFRVPNWVYAGAASVAALALAVTVSVDATGGLSSDPLRRYVAATALAPDPASQQVTVSSAAESELEPASPSGSEDEATGPPSLAAVTLAAPTSDTTERDGAGAAGGVGIEAVPSSAATPAPDTAASPALPETAVQDTGAGPLESTIVSPTAIPAEPEDGQIVRGPRSGPGPASTTNEVETAKSQATEDSVPVSESGELSLFEQDGGGTSTWWRVLEATAGVLAVVFLAGLALRRRAGRRDSA